MQSFQRWRRIKCSLSMFFYNYTFVCCSFFYFLICFSVLNICFFCDTRSFERFFFKTIICTNAQDVSCERDEDCNYIPFVRSSWGKNDCNKAAGETKPYLNLVGIEQSNRCFILINNIIEIQILNLDLMFKAMIF